MSTIYYCRPDYDADARHHFETNWSAKSECELRFIAEEAADHYHSRHDGWECSWPLLFSIYAHPDGDVLGIFEIDRDMTPVFHARKVEKP